MKTLYLPEMLELSKEELERIIEKAKEQPDSPSKVSLLEKLEQIKDRHDKI